MDQQMLLTIFVGISGVALLIQAGMLIGIYRTARSIEDKVSPLVPKIERLVETSQETVETSRAQILEISTKTNEILDSARRQLATIESVVSDASERAKVQIERAELMLDDTMTRAQETVALVHKGVMTPLREIYALATGLRTAFQFLMRGSRTPVAHATHDEEMFI